MAKSFLQKLVEDAKDVQINMASASKQSAQFTGFLDTGCKIFNALVSGSIFGGLPNNRITAIAPMSALRWPSPCEGRPVPVLTFHGTADTQNPYAGHVEGRNGEWVESVPEALAGWAGHNRCKGEVIVEDPPGPLATLRYEGCADNAEVRLVRIDGLGHTWARTEVDATTAMWQFFTRHTR